MEIEKMLSVCGFGSGFARSVARSPLMFGGSLPDNDDFTEPDLK